MDRKKEDTEETSKPTNLATLITTPITASTAATTILTPTTDDEASTESSDTFESWTLINDKEKLNKLREELEDHEQRVENLKNIDNDEEEGSKVEDKLNEQEIQLKDNNDDFSDGISIISESESVGRISPNPYLRDHLHDFNLKFSLSDHMDDSILNKLREEMENETTPLVVQQPPEPIVEQQLRQRRRSLTVAANNQALQKASQTIATRSGFYPIVKRGLQGIFYVGVGLAILGLIGKIVHPTWQPLASVGSSSGSSEELEQKVNDMELQNNLMRAEIDLLNKQVKYLATLNDPQQQQQQQKQTKYKDSKTFKAWTGNGDSLKPVDITKQDLRKPYKCPDGSFVEIANMCIEQSSTNDPSIVDQFGQVVNDMKEQSESFKTFEKVAEELQGFEDNPLEQLQEVFKEQMATKAKQKEFIKNKPIYQATEDYKQNLPPTEKYQKYQPITEDTSKPHKHPKYDDNSKPNKDFKKSFGKGENKPSNEFKKHYHTADNFRDNSNERKEWNSDNVNNISKERNYRKDNSKERFNKDFDDSKEDSPESKERYNKQKRYHDKKHDNDDDSGEWQEKYMKHREQLRKENEQKYQDNKNWYIKRGNSREHKRSGEKQYR